MTGLLLAPAVLIAGALAASSTAEKRVHPVAQPTRPTPAQRVVLRFRTVETLDGVYHAETHHRPKQAGCNGPASRRLLAPPKGRVVRLKLAGPRGDDGRRWCAGEYRATVYFKQTVRCDPPIQCGDSVEVAIGSTTFTVSHDPHAGNG